MDQAKNSAPRNVDDLIAALRIMRAYVAAKSDWPADAPSARQLQSAVDALQANQSQISDFQAQISIAIEQQYIKKNEQLKQVNIVKEKLSNVMKDQEKRKVIGENLLDI
jgi:hypothetical protein